jgi:hypothetical protein
MSKQKSSQTKQIQTPQAVKKFVDRDLCKVNPTKQQFEPTEAAPVRQHARMAGGG